MEYEYVMTIGQDSHRFEEGTVEGFNTIMLGGCPVPFDRKISANSDGDVILHAITNAVSGYTGINILGGKADELCLGQGVTDSRVYLEEALSDLGNVKITHLSLTIECLRPKLKDVIPQIREKLSDLLSIDPGKIGITATTGEGLTGFGKGEGIQVFACMTFKVPVI
ncbi:MAG: 2-C-methyl-D-erythritol 2,4-cyclodiphosphate synthase [Clostridiales bacterium]|nr:2-C-methyl-D-erythritol 2,4-cyclodiphosphate synthase [Clostridiales bacterium]